MKYQPRHVLTRAGIAAVAVLLAALGLGAFGTAVAHASTPLLTVTTHIINNYDSGGNGNWANDAFARTLSVSQENAQVCESDTSLSGFSSVSDFCYSAAIADSGTFTTLLNAFQPNQGWSPPQTGNRISNVVDGTFSGSASWTFYAPQSDLTDASNVLTSLNDNFTHPVSGADSTSQWYLQAFAPGVRSAISGAGTADFHTDWGWTYKTACNEQWVDSGAKGAGNNGFDGQSTPLTVDGNITGINSCPPPVIDTVTFVNPGSQSTQVGTAALLQLQATSSGGFGITFAVSGLPAGLHADSAGLISGTPTAAGTSTVNVTATDSNGKSDSGSFTWRTTLGVVLPPPPGNYGDEVNPYGNGFDAFQQRQYPGAVVAGWAATQADPATHFLRKAGTHAGAYQFEYAPRGSGTGLCVSDPGGGWPDPAGPDGLLLTNCNTGPWQQFVPQSDGTLKNVATGLYVNPAGTGAQLRGGSSPTPWGGSRYTWTDYSHLPL